VSDIDAPLTRLELSTRERQIVIARGCGLGTSAIGVILGITTSTVQTYQRNAKHKLGLDSTRQLGEYARQKGWC